MNAIKRSIALVVGATAVCVTASEYSEKTGYVTLLQSDSGDTYSFATAGNWSDEREPHSDTNYYVGAGLNLRIPSAVSSLPAFPANIVLQGKVTSNGSSGNNAKWGNVLMLPGSEYEFGATVGGIAAGNFTLAGTAESPSKFTYTRTTDYPKSLAMSILSEKGSYGCFSKSNAGIATLSGVDFSSCLGKFSFIGNCTFTMKTDSDFPGQLEMRQNGILQLSGNSKNTFGELVLRSGSTLLYSTANNTALATVTNLFVAESGVKITSNKYLYLRNDGDSTFQPIPAKTVPVVRLSSEAVAAGVPDLNEFSVSCIVRNGTMSLPTVSQEWTDNEFGGKDLSCVSREIVYKQVNCTADYSCFNTNDVKGAAYYFSDGKWPHGETDYWTDKNSFVNFPKGHPDYDAYTFPGKKFCIWGSSFGVYVPRYLTFPYLHFYGGSIRPMSTAGTDYIFNGKIAFSRADSTGTKIWLAEGNNVVLNSNVEGTGYIYAYVGSAYGEKYEKKPSGTLTLKGDNSAFTGKIFAYAPSQMTQKDTSKTAIPGPGSNVTVRVFNGTAFGGARSDFTFDAFKAYNHTRVTFAADATFDATNLGWYFPNYAYLNVEADKTAIVKETVSYEGTSVLEKEGAGALYLASVPAYADASVSGARMIVREGALGGGIAGAFNGLTVVYRTGSKLAIAISGETAVAETGVDIPDSVTFETGVKFAFSDPDGLSEREESFSVPLFSASVEKMEEIRAKLPASGSVRFGDRKLAYRTEVVENGAKRTCVGTFFNPGILLIIR